MAKGYQVLEMLLPNGGWVISEDDFDSIRYDEGVNPITRKEFDDGFDKFDTWKNEQEAIKAAKKTELLAKLGITEEEARILLS